MLDHDAGFDVASLSGNADGSLAGGPPGNRELVDSFQLNGATVGLDVARVTLRSGLSVWLFSSDSVPLIPQLARMSTETPIEQHLPDPLVDWKVAGTPVWRCIALALLAAILGPLSLLISRPAVGVAGWICRRATHGIDESALRVFVGPLRLLLSVIVWRAALGWAQPSAALRAVLEKAVSLLLFLSLALLAMAITDIAMRRLRTVLAARHRTYSYSVIPLASRVLKITILLLMIAAVLSSWGYNTTTILAGLGVGGVAIALAAQKTIENLFGGVAVITDQPVTVGDFCRFGDLVGTVEDVGLRSTRIRTLGRTVVSVPNGEFSTMTLENFSRRDKMWFHVILNLRRDTHPDQVRSLLTSITRMLRDRRDVEVGPLPVRFIGVGTYSLDLEVFAYVLTPDYDEFLQIQQDLFLWILDAVQEAGTSLAVPTQAYLSLSGGAPQQNGAPLHQPVS
ncbi:MAG TPA: mechanosensitive ion channel family protein [Candidatus Sulfopaludibacter sp.]|nr:mechanosensitive ion channel family protein [Candidatus Sulfopaludibacter sp.]